MARKPKLTNAHHIRRLHHHRVRWFIALAVGLLSIQVISHQQEVAAQKVLAYATNVSISALASATNQQRAANGLGSLALNSQLNSGAKSKADHMIAHNYWSHTAPDGTEPWKFFAQTGYDYKHAGENLAYGFDGSAEVVDAWMNSSGHRANVLGDYKDMGFGFSSGDSYQDGENTVIVAFYGTEDKPAPPAPAPAAPSKPAPSVKSTPTPAPTPTPEPTPAPAPTPEPAQSEPTPAAEETPASSSPAAEPTTTEEATAPAAPKSVTNLENILGGNGGWAVYASLGLIATSTAGFAATHWQLVRRGWKQSAHFILVHPALDIAILIALIATLLASSVGFIR